MSNATEKYRTYLNGVQVASALSHALDHAHKLITGHDDRPKVTTAKNEK